MTGTQENSKDHWPYLLNQTDALEIVAWEKGNQFLFWNLTKWIPKNQLTQDPKIFPKLAEKSNKGLI